MTVKDKAKKTIDVVLGLLAFLKWVPFLGKWRPVVIALSTVLTTISAIVVKCDQQAPQSPPAELPPSPTPTPTHIPSPTPLPTPRAPRILIDRVVTAQWPFTVRYTALFQYNTHLWADQWRLGTFGRDPENGEHVLFAVVLRSAGKRRLTVRDKDGQILAEKFVEVKN